MRSLPPCPRTSSLPSSPNNESSPSPPIKTSSPLPPCASLEIRLRFSNRSSPFPPVKRIRETVEISNLAKISSRVSVASLPSRRATKRSSTTSVTTLLARSVPSIRNVPSALNSTRPASTSLTDSYSREKSAPVDFPTHRCPEESSPTISSSPSPSTSVTSRFVRPDEANDHFAHCSLLKLLFPDNPTHQLAPVNNPAISSFPSLLKSPTITLSRLLVTFHEVHFCSSNFEPFESPTTQSFFALFPNRPAMSSLPSPSKSPT